MADYAARMSDAESSLPSGGAPGWCLRHTLRAHQGRIGEICWSADGALVATAGDDGYLIVWNGETGQAVRLLRLGGRIFGAAFAPNGKVILSSSQDPLSGPPHAGYVQDFDDREFEPLPPEVDELLGDYDVASDWSPDPDVPEGMGLPLTLWDVSTGERLARLVSEAVQDPPVGVAWSRDGRWIATNSEAGLGIWQPRTAALVELLSDVPWGPIAFSPDGSTVAIAGREWWAIYDHVKGSPVHESDADSLESLRLSYTDIAWSSRGPLALGLSNGTVQIVPSDRRARGRLLEAHTRSVTSLSYSADGSLLATKSLDGTVRLWDTTTWQVLSILKEPARGQLTNAGVAFAPVGLRIATLGPAGRVGRVWEIDTVALEARKSTAPTVHYSNAKVVLLGDASVGKTGLGLVLAGEQFRPTESSHARNIWLLEVEEQVGDPPERREIYLWDLAGQPGYRLLHQLHLGDIAVAVVLFDARDETDPFAGVRYWVRALRQVERSVSYPIPRLLVAARIDRGGPVVGIERIQAVIEQGDFAAYLETSAKDGRGVDALLGGVTGLIDWAKMQKVSSTGLFDSIKAFLVAERDRDRLLTTIDDLMRSYASTQDEARLPSDLRDEFMACVDRVAARGLIRRLSFGGLVLLRPEILDAYAAALIISARDEPDGMGSIGEDDARNGRFSIPAEQRITDPQLERLLLTATVEEVLWHEVALREHSEEGPYLVFPTQARREVQRLEELKRVWMAIEFEGPVNHVYATLVVRLTHAGFFSRAATFQNAATFRARESVVGVAITERDEGLGRLELFAHPDVDHTTRQLFGDYVHAHVERRALAGTVVVERSVSCGECGMKVTEQMVELATVRGLDALVCPICATGIQLPLVDFRSDNELAVREMNAAADQERRLAAARATLPGKEEVGEFDVFLAYHSEDKDAVRQLADHLRSNGINPWVDDEQIPPGRWFQDAIEHAIGAVKSAAIVLGPTGLGRWQLVELKAFTEECVERAMPVIPVLLPGTRAPKELRFLRQLTWVEFVDSVDDEGALQRLVWGITGAR